MLTKNQLDTASQADLINDVGALNDRHVGQYLKDYLAETVHGNWEGYEAQEVKAVEEFLRDFLRFVKSERS